MPSQELNHEYQQWRDRGAEATRLGHLEEALECFSTASDLAQSLDETTRDRAFCNLVAIEVEVGGTSDALIPKLRAILTKHGDVENCRLAAYHLARAYDLRKENQKALFYARIAMERSERIGLQSWLASSHNQMGNILIAESRFDQGKEHLETALALTGQDVGDSIRRAFIQSNLGYCHFVQGNMKAGFREVFAGLRIIRREDAEPLAAPFYETLCFGYLELERLERAESHGRRALRLAQEHGDHHTAKNCLFLLGEVASTAGDTAVAHAYFSSLQNQFYPQHDFLPDFLITVDVRGLVNLRA